MNIEDIEPGELKAWIKKLATDLLVIAEVAMCDSRCKFARKTLKNLKKLK